MDELKLLSVVSGMIIMILSLTVHECAHAAVAYWLGDDTAARMGRLTLDPRPHIDPIGTLLLPALGAYTGIPLFGWANPVPTNPTRYTRTLFGKRVTMGFGHMLVAIAGPLSNLLFAMAAIVVLGLAMRGSDVDKPLIHMLVTVVVMNIGLFVFNLIPVPPLDGSRVISYLLPYRLRDRYDSLKGIISFIGLMVLINSGVTRWLAAPFYKAATALAGYIASI